MAQILVLDDDPLMLSSLSDVLNSSGYTVGAAASGEAALKLAETATFDLVIADVRMSGMDGLQCIQQLRSRDPKIKSIVITGYASDDVPCRAMDASSCDYLRKPFTAEQLVQSVTRALKASSEKKGYKRLLDKARAAVQKVSVAATGMESARGKAFHWFYLGIRSGHLGKVAAKAAWDVIESIERDRIAASRDITLSSQARLLKDRYEKVSIFCKVPTIMAATGRKEAPLTLARFQPLFLNVREGKISCEQLKLAVDLRAVSAEELIASPQLLELKQLIWNDV